MLALLSFSASFNAPTASMLGRSSFVAQASPVTLSRALAPRAAITMDEVEDKVKSIIAEQLGVEASSVTPDASFTEDLGADSLDAVELIMAIEEAFDIEIPDEDAEKLETVGNAIDYLNKRLSE